MTTPVAESASAQPKTAAAATPSTTTPAAPSTSTARPTPQPKKKKKSGLASFFAALGCGSSEPLEDKRKPAMSEIHGQSGSATKSVGTKPVAAVAPTKDVAKPTADSTEVTLTEGDNTVTSAARAEPIKTTETTEETPKSGPTVAELGLGAVVGTGAVAGAAVAANAVSEEDTNKEAAVVVAPSTPVQIPEDETAGMTSAAVQPPGSGSALLAANPPTPDDKTQSSDYVATESNTGTSSQQDYNMMAAEDEEEEDDEDRLVAQGGLGIPIDQDGREMPLLPPMDKAHAGRKCLVLDLDETLLHSSFKMIPNADYIVPVEIESQTHNVYVIKRPGVDNFLQKMGEIYEVVVFTASLSKYADPVLDMLDIHHVVRHRLFRESCYNHKGNYVKDLSQLGRTMESCIIIDNSPASYIFHPNNAVPVSTWFNDPHDTELTDLCPFLTDLGTVDDIRGVLDGSL